MQENLEKAPTYIPGLDERLEGGLPVYPSAVPNNV